MLPDRVSNPGPLTYESGALPIAQRGPAELDWISNYYFHKIKFAKKRKKIRSYLLLPVILSTQADHLHKRELRM